MKRIVKKILCFSLAATLVLGLMVGCSKSAQGGAKSGGKVTLTYMTLSDWPKDLKPSIDEFQKENPNITVKCETYSFDQLAQVIEVKMGANSKDYDILSVDVPKVAAYTERGYLLPMDKYFTAADKSQLISSAVQAGTWKGRFMAPPMNTSSQLLFYNKDLLKAAGVDFPSEDVNKRLTWEDLVPLAQKVMKANDPNGSKGIMGLMLEQVNRPYQIDALPNSMGGKSIGDDGLTVDGIINSSEWVKACQFYGDLFNKYKVSFKGITADNCAQYFTSGKIAYFVGGTWNLASNKGKVNFGYAPHPYFQDGKPVTPTGSWHFGIPKNSQHPDEAANFIKFMSVGKGNDLWIATHGDMPSKVSLLDAFNTDPKYNNFPESAYKICAYEAKNTAVVRPVTPGYSEWETIMGNTYADISNGENAKTALDKAVQQIDTAFAKYK